ncbi:NB-ARC domain-containing protein [Nostoc sp. KVJ20]|uniref:NB-ARC domain-containing protein n=1 Tax=Nostoc sp. KVJ20 TaxID=457944 RepID=UPI000A038BFB|nr:NB-ARC domain-containing protein [Nostoc sp. KVJ20]
MPRQTYGPEPKKRVKRLLEALLYFVDGEFGDSNFKIESDWKEADSINPKLTVQTTLVVLELLTQKDRYPGKLTKAQIREALNLLKDFLKILEDNRLQTQGSDDWHFTLKLWSRDREKNLKEFDEAWEKNRPKKSKELAANLSKDESVAVTPEIKLTLFQAPPLPTYFVERPEYSDDLKTRLLNGSSSDSRTLVITAIHGLGSVGKSTLAAALAHNAEIQSRFCDGILWATLGQQPDVLSLLSGWVQALGDYNFKPISIEATSTHLRTLLYDKAVLLVVDDAWNTKDASVFNVGGVRCQVLVTTREGAIADALGASTYSLDIMTASQAMELLTKKLGREIRGVECQSAEKLAKGVGYLPLALELAAAQVVDGRTWAVLLRDIQQEIARLKSLDRPGAKDTTDEASLKRLSLTASLNLSIKRLAQEDKEYFTWLGVLPEDVNITPKMTATLWDIADERDASDSLKDLQSKALLLLGAPLADGTPTYRLHDLFHDLARNLLTAPPQPKHRGDLLGLGISLADAHAILLEKYRQKTQNNLWHTLPNDGYIHQHLVWHLDKAGQLEEIHQLLREESATGNNGWYEVREKLGETAGYITDISRAWELVEVNWTEATLPQVVGLQCRYALITASLNSLAANLPVELLVALVKNNVWSPEQGLAYALQKPEPKEKAEAFTELVNYLPPNLEKLALSEALAASRAIQSEWYRAQALSALADKLPAELLPQALEAAQAIQSERYRAQALSALADKLPDVLPQALEAARAIQSELYRAQALSALTGKLPNVLPQALEATRAIQDERYCAQALSVLANKLSAELLPQALEAAQAIQDEEYRTQALSALADKLPNVLPQVLEAARAIQDKYFCAQILSALADKLPNVLPQALEAARAIQDKYFRAQALSVLADKLPNVLPQALEAARAIQSERDRGQVLSALADKLPTELLPQALEAAHAIQSERYRAQALSALANKLPHVLPQALEAARAIQDQRYRAQALSALANKLPAELLPQAIEVTRAIQGEEYHAQALSALADKLPAELLPQALEATRAIQSEKYRAQALSALANKLPHVLPQALEATRAIQDEEYRTQVLSALANKLLAELLPQALEATRAIRDEEYRAQALSALADKLPAELLPQALEVAQAIQDEEYRAQALSALADKLPAELLPEALEATRAIKHEEYRAQALSALTNKLPAELLPEALEAARAIQYKEYRAQALSALVNKMPDVLPEALEVARAIQHEEYRAQALSALVNKMPDVLPEALEAARAIQYKEYRAQALSALVNKMPDVLLPQAIEVTRAIQYEEYRAQALSGLANKLPAELLPQALEVAQAIQDEEYRAQALSALADKLPAELLPQAIKATRAIQSERYRTQALSALADKLPAELLPQVLEVARAIQDERYRVQALSVLANKLPDVLPQALEVARTIQDEEDRAQALSALAPSLSQMPLPQLFPLWEDTLHQLSLRTRPNLLSDIKALFPIIFAFDSEAATAELVRAIINVGRWWR